MSKDKIVQLFSKEEYLVKETIDEAIVDCENGDIINCAVVLIDRDGTITYSYANKNQMFTMIGAIECLKQEFSKD